MARTTEQKKAENKDFTGLVLYREHLKAARRHLVHRLAEDDDPARKIPDCGWMRILDSVQGCLEATEAVLKEDGEGGADVP